MSKKELLATIFYHSGLLRFLAPMRPGVTVFGYHRIRPDGGPTPDVFDAAVFGPAQSEFERQVIWLKNQFAILSESELLDAVRRPRIAENCVAITFDDGYRDNYELAYPVLRARLAPAVFFVCPGLIDRGELGWWDLIAYLIKKSDKTSISLLGETLALGSQKAATAGKLQEWMKRRPHSETASLVNQLSAACEVPLPSRALQSEELMTWDQIREASRGGVAIASHTHTHRVLGTLPEEDQRWELRESKAALERQLSCPVRTIAYPAGRRGNFTVATKRIAQECGYEAGFSYHSGFNSAGAIDTYDIARIAPAETFGPMFACATAMPEVFTWTHKSD